jgi:mono/diheme cytochrome c family protein
VTIGFPRVGMNCAMCHTATYRARPGDAPIVVPAAPAHQVAPQQYLRFLMLSATDPRFTASTILDEIAKNTRLSLLDRLLYRLVIVPETRRTLRRLGSATAWMWERPDWNRGRADLLNPLKYAVLKQPIDTTIGHSDMAPLWAFKQHLGYSLGWDGSNTNLQEVVLFSALAGGASAAWIDRDFQKWTNTRPEEMSSLRRVQDYITNLAPPPYPFPLNRALLAPGEAIYRRDCASCHAASGTRTGRVIPISEIGTDRKRFEAFPQAAVTALNAYSAGRGWKSSGFKATTGYVAVPLEGVWLRAPYLHNGSVPTLADLLEPTDRRPKMFRRGYDVYDPARVGFVTTGEEADRIGTMFDTSAPGGGNGGHLYGTDLPADDKAALIEYLKTL